MQPRLLCLLPGFSNDSEHCSITFRKAASLFCFFRLTTVNFRCLKPGILTDARVVPSFEFASCFLEEGCA